jgi:hypothetical protein
VRTKPSGTFTRFFVMIMTAVALFLPVNLGLAQSQMPSRQGPQPEVPFRSADSVPKMRKTTNEQRKAAAQRNADRRAKAQRRAAAATSQAGVKQ